MFPLILGLAMMFIYYYEVIKFAKRILPKSSGKNFDNLLIATLNVCVFLLLYTTGISFVVTLLCIGLLLFLEFAAISKSSIRQLSFGVSVFMFNITAIHVLVLVVLGHITATPVLLVYQNRVLFFLVIFISYSVLFLLLKLMGKIVPMDKLKGMSSTKVYSEVITITATLMILYLWISAWVSFTNELYILYLVSTITNVFIMGIAFYCLFFFNVKLIALHSFKRKSDRAEMLRKVNVKKQTLAEKKLYTDDLTGVYNKRFIDKQMDLFCQQTDFNFAILYGDLVALKHVNDTFGHSIGDHYIISVARALKNSVRNDDFVARIGGDEFLVLLSMVTQADLETVVHRIKCNIESENAKVDFNIHVNLGYVFIDSDHNERDIVQICEKADALMRADKRAYYARGGEYQ